MIYIIRVRIKLIINPFLFIILSIFIVSVLLSFVFYVRNYPLSIVFHTLIIYTVYRVYLFIKIFNDKKIKNKKNLPTRSFNLNKNVKNEFYNPLGAFIDLMRTRGLTPVTTFLSALFFMSMIYALVFIQYFIFYLIN